MTKIVLNTVALLVVSLLLLNLSQGKVLRFENASNSSIYFAYKFNNGTLYNATTYPFWDKVHIAIDANGNAYWMKFTEAELNASKPFLKSVFPVNRTKDGIEFKDDYLEYSLVISENGEASIQAAGYVTWWDFSKVCFYRTNNSNNQSFKFKLASTNNNLSYVGITQLDAKNPLRHTFDVKDEHRTGEYEVKFTKSEYESKKTICKPVERLSEFITLAPSFAADIDPNLIKSLIG